MHSMPAVLAATTGHFAEPYVCLILEADIHSMSQVSDLMSHLIPEHDLKQGTSQDRMYPTLGNTHMFE